VQQCSNANKGRRHLQRLNKSSAQVDYDRHMVETLDGGVLALDVVAAAPGLARPPLPLRDGAPLAPPAGGRAETQRGCAALEKGALEGGVDTATLCRRSLQLRAPQARELAASAAVDFIVGTTILRGNRLSNIARLMHVFSMLVEQSSKSRWSLTPRPTHDTR